MKLAFELIKAGLEATYEHAVTEERLFEQEHQGFVEFGTMHAFYVQPGIVHTEGDIVIVIVTPYNIYTVKDQQFDMPLGENWQPIDGRGQKVPRQVVHSTHVEIACKNGKPSGALPDFPERGVPKDAEDVKGLAIAPTTTFTSQPESLAAKAAQ